MDLAPVAKSECLPRIMVAVATMVLALGCEDPTPAPRALAVRSVDSQSVATSPILAETAVEETGGDEPTDQGEADTGLTDSATEDDGGMVDQADSGDGTNLVAPPLLPLSDDEALQFLKDHCADCHNTKDGSSAFFWAFDPATLNKNDLLIATAAPTVYFTLRMRSKDIVGGTPGAMPIAPLKDEVDKTKLKRLLVWFEKEAPQVVTLAYARYSKGSEDPAAGVGVIPDYQCDSPASFRTFIRRVTNDVFSREPTQDEIALSVNGADKPTTLEDRKKIAAKLLSDPAWKAEFIEKGLKKFADKLSGAAQIEPMLPQLTAAQAADLKLELYQILKQNFETKTYKDILLSNKVMVSPNTASLYGCQAPLAETWSECEMKAPRDSYFSTFSYLRSKPSSFLVENNNYGRAATMFFVLRGDVFKAAFDQEEELEGVREVASCLKTADYRGRRSGTNIAPFGSLGVPKFANLCQSCHIQRQMAAGSILFRPYNKVGNLFGTAFPLNGDGDFSAATGNDMVNHVEGQTTFVDPLFLQNLLAATGEQACIPGEKGKPDVILSDVGDLAASIIGDGVELAGGLARHLPRAFSNLGNTSEEIIVKINKAWVEGGGKLGPVFEAYFASETYACSKR